MEDVPNAQSVGREFVRQYYTMMNERPDSLHRFFSHTSSYVHGGIEKPGEEQPPVQGQAAIHQKIMSLGFKDCHAKIRQVDCQETVNNAVVIQVTGELSNNMGPMRRFMQTFVLARQSPKMFYVHNDIFRYQDEVFHDFEEPVPEFEENHIVAEETSIVVEDAVVISNSTEVDTAAAESQCQDEVELESELCEEPADSSETGVPVSQQPASTAVSEQVVICEQQQEQVAATTSDVDSGAVQDAAVEPITQPATETIPVTAAATAAVTTEPAVQKPFSWASLASKNTSTSGNTPTNAVPPKPQATIKPERKAEATPPTPAQPLPQRTPRSAPSRSTDQSIGDSAADRKWSSYESNEGKQAPGAVVVPDSQQLFVGNLPHVVEDKELIEFFSQFGTVLDVKINRKGMTRELPNFGFVSFDCVEAVSKALAAKPLMLYGKHRINVEEKKEQSELFSRPRGAPRGGRGFAGPFRGSGSYRGGRGGHFASHNNTTSPAAVSSEGNTGGGFNTRPR